MSLSTVKRTPKPPKIVLYGPPGIGKTTWAAKAPDPVFIPLEDGLASISGSEYDHVASFPMATEWEKAADYLAELCNEEHQHKTVVIDSADWLERLMHEQIADLHGKPDISRIPYGEGYKEAKKNWKQFLSGLDYLVSEKGVMPIILSHSVAVRVEPPDAAPYDQWTLGLHKHTRDLLIEWADCLLFANSRVLTKTEETKGGKTRNRAVTIQERTIHTVNTPFCAGKNRYNLPPEIAMDDFGHFAAAMGWQ